MSTETYNVTIHVTSDDGDYFVSGVRDAKSPKLAGGADETFTARGDWEWLCDVPTGTILAGTMRNYYEGGTLQQVTTVDWNGTRHNIKTRW